MRIYFVFIFTLLMSSQLQARGWSGVGNGGFIIECNGDEKYLYDYYESEKKGLKLSHEIPGDNLIEKIDTLFERLKKIDPNRYLNYKYQYDNYFLQNQSTTEADVFVLTPEEAKKKKNQKKYGLGDVRIPDNCELKLVIQQREPKYEGDDIDKREGRLDLLLYNKIWNELNANIQASLIMHELFYRENILRRIHFTSAKIRYLNSLLVSENFNQLKQGDWNKYIIESYLYPMFPDFKPISKGLPSIDLEVATGSAPGYVIHDYISPILKGVITIDSFDKIKVIAESPLFLLGVYPEYFSLQDEQKIDLSHLTDRNLVLGVEPRCLFRVGFVKSKKVPQVLSLGLTKNDREPDDDCTAYLDTETPYQHDQLSFNGRVPGYIESNRSGGVRNKMTLKRPDFGYIQLQLNNEVKELNSVEVDLSNGDIISFEVCTICENDF